MLKYSRIISHQVEELDFLVFVVHGQTGFDHHRVPVLLDHVDEVLLVGLDQKTSPVPLKLKQ